MAQPAFATARRATRIYLTIGGGAAAPADAPTGQAPTDTLRQAAPATRSRRGSRASSAIRQTAYATCRMLRCSPRMALWGHFFVVCWSDTAYYSADGAATCTNRPILWPRPLLERFWRNVSGRASDGRDPVTGESEMGHPRGQSQPHLLPIAKAEFSSSERADCYAINQPPRLALPRRALFKTSLRATSTRTACRTIRLSLLHSFRH